MAGEGEMGICWFDKKEFRIPIHLASHEAVYEIEGNLLQRLLGAGDNLKIGHRGCKILAFGVQMHPLLCVRTAFIYVASQAILA